MNVVLFGTPNFSVPVFDAILGSRHKLLAVVSQPDRAKNRKGQLLPTPLKQAALAAGVPVFQFASVKNEGIDALKKLQADIFVTAAYGQLLSQQILDIPTHGVINVHASLLPKYRGSSPIQHAILGGETQTGITIMQTCLGLDCGDIILSASLDIGENETCAALSDRLSCLGAKLVLDALDLIESGQAAFIPQDESKATKCGKITADCERISFAQSAQKIHNQVRAVCGRAHLGGQLVKILQTAVLPESDYVGGSYELGYNEAKTGQALDAKRLIVRCGEGAIEVLQIQPEGGKPMMGKDFLLGRKGTKLFFE